MSIVVEVVEGMGDEDEVEIGAIVAIGLYIFLETAHLIFIHHEFYLIGIEIDGKLFYLNILKSTTVWYYQHSDLGPKYG